MRSINHPLSRYLRRLGREYPSGTETISEDIFVDMEILEAGEDTTRIELAG